MAFLLSSPLRALKQKVSKDRYRFQDFDHDLDLSYITANIKILTSFTIPIPCRHKAMAFPSSGLESVWRNHIDEVVSLLKQNHEDKFKIWNLSGRKYNYNKFDNRVQMKRLVNAEVAQVEDFGFPDHHSPPLELLLRIVSSINDYLTQDPKNVAVVHCLGGKGRTGTVIACYLVYCGLFATTSSALDYFAQMRSEEEKGVTQPSQKRYFTRIMNREVTPIPTTRCIRRVIMSPVPKWCRKQHGCRPLIRIYSTEDYPKDLLFSTSEENAKLFLATDSTVEIELNCLTRADTMIVFSHVKKRKNFKPYIKPQKMFRISFHTAFVDNTLELSQEQIDDFSNRKKFDSYFEPTFQVKIVLENSDEVIATSKPTITEASFDKFMNQRPKTTTFSTFSSKFQPRLKVKLRNNLETYLAALETEKKFQRYSEPTLVRGIITWQQQKQQYSQRRFPGQMKTVSQYFSSEVLTNIVKSAKESREESEGLEDLEQLLKDFRTQHGLANSYLVYNSSLNNVVTVMKTNLEAKKEDSLNNLLMELSDPNLCDSILLPNPKATKEMLLEEALEDINHFTVSLDLETHDAEEPDGLEQLKDDLAKQKSLQRLTSALETFSDTTENSLRNRSSTIVEHSAVTRRKLSLGEHRRRSCPSNVL